MIILQLMHHIVIIASDYSRNIHFCCQVLSFTLISKHYCTKRDFWKKDLTLQIKYLIKLFFFLSALWWLSRLETQGLCYLAFSVADIYGAIASLEDDGVICESVLVDAFTGKKFTFYRSRSIILKLYET